VVDKSSFGNVGNGMAFKTRNRRRGADPPKNESGRTGTILTPTFDKNRAFTVTREMAPALLPKCFQLQNCITHEADLRYAITVPEIGSDLIH